jgi:hypothetical protein
MFNLRPHPIGRIKFYKNIAKQPRQETDDALFNRVNKVDCIFNDIEKKEMEKVMQQIRMYLYITTRTFKSYY